MKATRTSNKENPVKKDDLVTALASCGKLMKRSLTRIRRRCGKSQCCCMSGQLHESLAVTYKEGGKSFCIHVPRHLHKQAQEAIADYHKLKNLIQQISQINVKAFKDLARKQHIPKKRQIKSSDVPSQSGGKR